MDFNRSNVGGLLTIEVFLTIEVLLLAPIGALISSERSSYSDIVLLLARQLFQILSISANISIVSMF